MQSIKYLFQILVGLSILVTTSHAQGPYSYQAPTGTNIYSTAGGGKTKTVYATSFGNIPSGSDGIRVSATFNMDLSKEAVLFTLSSSVKTILQVIYKDQTLVIRKYRPNADVYYDYTLYDRMFDLQSNQWRIALYFTGSFLWLESTISGSNLFYLSPVFYGIDSQGYYFMEGFIYKADGMNILIGDAQSSNTLGSDNILIYAFKYEDIRNDIQTHFSAPASLGETSVPSNNYEADNKINVMTKDETLYVRTSDGSNLEMVEVYDMQGRIVASRRSIKNVEVKIPALRKKSIYIVKSTTNNTSYSQKVFCN